jgi:hypothetical protein
LQKKIGCDNLSRAQYNALRKQLQAIADAYITAVKVRAATHRLTLSLAFALAGKFESIKWITTSAVLTSMPPNSL